MRCGKLFLFSFKKKTKMYRQVALKTHMAQTGIKGYSSNVFKDRFDGKVAVVSGSTRGIGFSIARRLAQEGAKVIICSRKQANVNEAIEKLAAEGLKVIGIVCHVGKKKDRKLVLDEAEKLGGIDTLILNAGINPIPGPITKCNEELWDKVFDTNIKSQFFFTKEALPLIKKQQGASIIYNSTIAAYMYGKDLGLYSVSKICLLSLVKVLANELGPDDITVNCVAPGLIDTKFGSILLKDEDAAKNSVPLKRIGVPDDVAGCVTYLASKDARYITGETILISGGMFSRL